MSTKFFVETLMSVRNNLQNSFSSFQSQCISAVVKCTPILTKDLLLQTGFDEVQSPDAAFVVMLRNSDLHYIALTKHFKNLAKEPGNSNTKPFCIHFAYIRTALLILVSFFIATKY